MNAPIRGEEPADFVVYSDFMVRQSPIGYTGKPEYKQQHKLTNGLYTLMLSLVFRSSRLAFTEWK